MCKRVQNQHIYLVRAVHLIMYWLGMGCSACSRYWMSLLHIRRCSFFTVAQSPACWLEYSWGSSLFKALWAEGGVECAPYKLNSFCCSGYWFESNHVHQYISESKTQWRVSRRCGKALCALRNRIVFSRAVVGLYVRKNLYAQVTPGCSTLTKF